MPHFSRWYNISIGSCIAGAVIGAVCAAYKCWNRYDIDRVGKARFTVMGGVCGLLWPVYLPLYAAITHGEKKDETN